MSDPGFWNAVEELFAETSDLSLEAQREALDQFAGPESVRREVEKLLAAHVSGPEIEPLPGGAHLPLGDVPFPAISLAGGRLGPWSVRREVGRGGMGAVYEAVRDDDQYQKRVAIKTLTPTLDHEGLARRFRREQQILASLEHPHIATLIDGGVTAEGLPYFVMEFVDGVPITQYCERNRLGLKTRLDLFRQACAAVEFAHRNLIVHRDIKPSNVFVTADGTVKLLDFGIAKLMRDRADVEATLTNTGYRAFTVAYASPEQVRGGPISTATDIYSLGTMLCELVTGRLPFLVDQLAPDEALARICDTSAPTPSQIATDAAAGAMGLRDRRQLARALRGELDDIVLNTLRKEPERRYPTVAALSEDLKRYLQGQQVMARPDTWRYRVRTFTRRNRGLTIALGLAALFLTVGALGFAWQARQAGLESVRANRVVRFMERLIATPTPGGLSGVAGELLANTLRDASADFHDEPLALAAVTRTAAKAYVAYYQFDRAEQLLDSALALDRRHAGARSAEVGRDLTLLAATRNGRGDYADAVALSQEAVSILRKQPSDRPEDLSEALLTLGNSLTFEGRPTDAIPVLEEAVAREEARRRAALYPRALSLLGFAHDMTGAAAQAESTYRAVLTLFDSLPQAGQVERGVTEFTLTTSLLIRQAFPEAEQAGRKALETFRRWYGSDHVMVAHSHSSLSTAAIGMGALSRAEAHVDSAEQIMRGAEVSPMERTRVELARARLFVAQGHHAEAAALAERVLAERRSRLPGARLMIGEAAGMRGSSLMWLRRFAEAEPLLLESESIFAESLGPNHALVRGTKGLMVFFYTAWGRPELAAQHTTGLPPPYVAALEANARQWAAGRP